MDHSLAPQFSPSAEASTQPAGLHTHYTQTLDTRPDGPHTATGQFTHTLPILHYTDRLWPGWLPRTTRTCLTLRTTATAHMRICAACAARRTVDTYPATGLHTFPLPGLLLTDTVDYGQRPLAQLFITAWFSRTDQWPDSYLQTGLTGRPHSLNWRTLLQPQPSWAWQPGSWFSQPASSARRFRQTAGPASWRYGRHYRYHIAGTVTLQAVTFCYVPTLTVIRTPRHTHILRPGPGHLFPTGAGDPTTARTTTPFDHLSDLDYGPFSFHTCHHGDHTTDRWRLRIVLTVYIATLQYVRWSYTLLPETRTGRWFTGWLRLQFTTTAIHFTYHYLIPHSPRPSYLPAYTHAFIHTATGPGELLAPHSGMKAFTVYLTTTPPGRLHTKARLWRLYTVHATSRLPHHFTFTPDTILDTRFSRLTTLPSHLPGYCAILTYGRPCRTGSRNTTADLLARPDWPPTSPDVVETTCSSESTLPTPTAGWFSPGRPLPFITTTGPCTLHLPIPGYSRTTDRILQSTKAYLIHYRWFIYCWSWIHIPTTTPHRTFRLTPPILFDTTTLPFTTPSLRYLIVTSHTFVCHSAIQACCILPTCRFTIPHHTTTFLPPAYIMTRYAFCKFYYVHSTILPIHCLFTLIPRSPLPVLLPAGAATFVTHYAHTHHYTRYTRCILRFYRCDTRAGTCSARVTTAARSHHLPFTCTAHLHILHHIQWAFWLSLMVRRWFC